MKTTVKSLVIIFFVICIVSFASCSKEAGTAPAQPTSTPTTVIPWFGMWPYVMDDFEDNNTSTANGNWSALNDAGVGGGSTVGSFGTMPGGYNSNYALGVTATLKATLAPSAGGYTVAAIGSRGYVSVEYNTAPVSLTTSAFLNFLRTGTKSTNTSFKVLFYDDQERYCSSDSYTLTASWQGTQIVFPDGIISTGGSYTTNDVLQKVVKIVFLLRFEGALNTTDNVELFIDRLALDILI